MNGMISTSRRAMKLPTERVFSVGYQMRLLQSKPPSQLELKMEPEDVSALLETAALIVEHILLRAHLEREGSRMAMPSLRWDRCYMSGAQVRVLTGYVMEIVNAQRTKCLIIEDVLGDKPNNQNGWLVRQLLDQER